MSRFLILFVLIVSIVVPSASAQTPEAENRFTFVSGTALDLVPEGKPGIIDIVPVGTSTMVETHGRAIIWPFGTAGMPVVVWNNTTAPVSGLHVFGMVRSSSGVLRAAVEVPVFPFTILPGEFAFTVVTFGEQLVDVPTPDDVITFEAYFPTYYPNHGSSARSLPLHIVALEVVGAEVQGMTIVGTVRGLPPVDQMITTVALCFDATGQVSGMAYDFAVPDVTEGRPGTLQFEADVGLPCDRYLVAAQTEFSAETTVG